jgi:GntP family gluconate:H+ symporter
MTDTHLMVLLWSAIASVIALVLLIAWARLNAFLTITLCSLALALAAGIPLPKVVASFEAGVGATLGHVAIVVALGTMLGKMLAESGATERVAEALVDAFGPRHVSWAMLCAGILVGIPVFFEVGLVLLTPLAYNVAKKTGRSLVVTLLPMAAGLAMVHGLLPPHPAALMAATAFHADLGKTIGWALVVGIPSAILAGPIWSSFIAKHIKLPETMPFSEDFLRVDEGRTLPSFSTSVALILMPVLLMLIGSWADKFTVVGSQANLVLHFLGNADVALLLATLLSLYVLGLRRGFTRDNLLHFTNECLGPTASVTLLVGAGGGFGRVLMDSGVSNVLLAYALRIHVPLLLLAWLVATFIRIATGSTTVAMATASSILAGMALTTPGGAVRPEFLAIATGAGATGFSHVNDGGFWLVKEYSGMSVADTLKSWTMVETILSISSFSLVCLLQWLS